MSQHNSRKVKMSPIGRHLSSEVFVNIFRFVGIWFPEERSYLYSFYAFMIYVLCVCMYAVFAVMHLLSIKSVDEATQALFMLVIVFQLFVKATCFLYFNRRIRKLLHRLHDDFELHNDAERNLVNTRLRSILNLLILYLILSFICVSSGSIVSALKTTTELPFPTWYPLDWTNNKLSYWLAWGHISFATYMAIGSTPSVQMFSSYLIAFVSVLMDVLGQRLCSLWSTVDSNKELNDSSVLIECIQMHQKILEVLNEYEICFSNILLYVVCSTALSLCCTVYQLVMHTNEDLSAYLFLITFFTIMNCELYLPCYFGNEIILRANDLLKQTYFSNWMDMTYKSKKSFIYLRERLKLGNAIVVCENAYRLFTLLQSLS